ncbi:MAG: hypothetical protein KKE89_09125 [Actinobacteria bacterium]|nr:hypothetical protein [Actinomycetota bacterium]
MTRRTAGTMLASHRLPGSIIGLAILLGLLAAGALQGGIAMIIDPLTPLGMTVEYLQKAPVDTYFWPGMFLMGIAAASALVAAGLLSGWQWRWAAGLERAARHRWPWIGAIAIGAVLLAFEVIELFIVPFHPVMHPLLIAWSAAIIGLAGTRPAGAYLSAGSATEADAA